MLGLLMTVADDTGSSTLSVFGYKYRFVALARLHRASRDCGTGGYSYCLYGVLPPQQFRVSSSSWFPLSFTEVVFCCLSRLATSDLFPSYPRYTRYLINQLICRSLATKARPILIRAIHKDKEENIHLESGKVCLVLGGICVIIGAEQTTPTYLS